MRGRSIWLAKEIVKNNYTIGAEIGAAIGLTTGYVLQYCPKLKKLYVADDWRPVPGSGIFDSTVMEEDFRGVVRNYSSKVIILKGVSWEVARRVEDETLDFIFVDASHDYISVANDLGAWIPKVKKGGLLSGHDVHWGGVKQALQDIIPDYQETGIDNTWMKIKEE